GTLPLAVFRCLGLDAPEQAQFAPHAGGGGRRLPNRIPISEDLLWLMGFFLAEGCDYGQDGTYFISFCSDDCYLERAKGILEQTFGVQVGRTPYSPDHGPQIYSHSKILQTIFTKILRLRDRRIPAWVLQLPLSRLKHFLEGFRCGDGTHSGKKLGNE